MGHVFRLLIMWTIFFFRVIINVLTFFIFNTPHFLHSALSALSIFYSQDFLNSAFSTLRTFHTLQLRVFHRSNRNIQTIFGGGPLWPVGPVALKFAVPFSQTGSLPDLSSVDGTYEGNPGKEEANDKNHSSWFARSDQKMSFHFPHVVLLVSERSAWHSEKHPKATLPCGMFCGVTASSRLAPNQKRLRLPCHHSFSPLLHLKNFIQFRQKKKRLAYFTNRNNVAGLQAIC